MLNGTFHAETPDRQREPEYITRSSLSLSEFAICRPSTQYRNEIVANGIEARYRLPERHQRSTPNDSTNTNSVSFDLIQFHLGTFSPSRFHVQRRLLSFCLSLFFPYTSTSFFFPIFITIQANLHHFLPPPYSILVRFRLFPGPSPWLHPAKLTRTWVSGSLFHDTLRCI